MKKIKWTLKVSSMFLAFSFLVLSINSPYSTINSISLNNTTSRVLETEYSAPDSDEISKESLENQKEINGLIVNYESEAVQSKLTISDGTSESLFPESYAGAYYDYEKDKLIMCLTDNNDYDFFQEYFKNEIVDYKYATYSFDYLLAIIRSVNEEVFNKYQLNYVADDMFNNCVKVSIPDKSIINDFDEFLSQNGFDINAVRYIIEEKTENPAT